MGYGSSLKGRLLIDFANYLFKFGLVLGLTGGAGSLIVNDARRFGLAHALAGIGLYRLGGGEPVWLAFRDHKIKYVIGAAGTEAWADNSCWKRVADWKC